ncbi:hypothetical protein OG989_12515 [Micromonospora sp. NBC_01740]|uniref:hypothetical protein n=1 Tax=Micromonospora sp. NBC_01740 TaxID=2975986 RepID=UPI002E11FAD3|nr:hypothetical protein OG989_12515 [Micromonospora sp. NBC_01740]
MFAGLETPFVAEAELAMTAVLAASRSARHCGVVVDSPCEAGESKPVASAITQLAEAGGPLILRTQTSDQVEPLFERLACKTLESRQDRLSAADHQPSNRVRCYKSAPVAATVEDRSATAIALPPYVVAG